jgi:hypothetical protein
LEPDDVWKRRGQHVAVEPVPGALLVEADEPAPERRLEIRGAVARQLDE